MGGKRVYSGVVFLCAAFLWAATAWGQASTSLRGVVTDPSGAAVPGAKVTLVNPSTNLARSVTTGTNGSYDFPELLPGTYTLTVEATGFQKYEQSGLTVRVALPATQNVRLKVGAVTQVVSVSGEAPLLNTTNASMGETMGSTQIGQLPLEAANVPNLLSLQAGVVYTGDRTDLYQYDTRGGAVNGERSDQNTISLDGVVVNDQFNNGPFTSVLPITVDSVQEFRVTTSNDGAASGRSAGAQIEMVTKGGTNQFHGSLYEINRSGIGEANDFFIKSSEALTGQPNTPPHLVRNIFGGSLGGPFMKNRFFFFFNYEGHRLSEAVSAVRTVPSPALRDGIIQYQCDGGKAACPGGSVQGLSGKSYTVAPGNYGISPNQGPINLTTMDPLGLGPNPASIAFFNQYPTPNDYTVGDPPNFVGYRFAAPQSQHNNWMIGRLDYKITSNGNHSLFIRGSGEDDTFVNQPYLPAGYVLGGIPETSEKNLSKGFVAGYTGIFGAHWVNNFRYGLTHQSVGIVGNSNQPWNFMRDLTTGQGQVVYRNHSFTVPLQSISDDVSYTRGSHTFQFGGSMSLIRRNSISQQNSFSDGSTNADWIDTAGIAGSQDSLDPGAAGLPAVAASNTHSYDFPLVGLLGMVTEVDATYNDRVNSNLTGTLLPQGAAIPRHYAMDEYNLYWQDVWQVRPNLTLTYGLNWGLMGAIGETAGQEVVPTFSLGQWFNQRAQRASQGIPSNQDPLVTFGPGGPSYGSTGYYPSQTRNFAPRIGIAWTPRPSGGWLEKIVGDGDKTVVRAGFGMYYDHFGPELATAFDANGSFGLTTTLTNFAGCETISSSPRMTGINTIPTYDYGNSCTDLTGNTPQQIFVPPPFGNNPTYPVTFPTNGPAAFAITWGLDNGLRTPYSYAIDFSVDRQLPGGIALDLSYVGHLAHRLLVQEDLATPYNLVDPKTGISYFQAVSRFSEMARQQVDPTTVTPAMIGSTAQYWPDMMQAQSSYSFCTVGGSTPSIYQAMYDVFNCFLNNETTGLFLVDLYGFPTQPKTGLFSYYNPQYSSLYGWRSIGYSNYNAFQLSLRKRMSHGLLFDFNYTYSKSLDIGSDATSVGAGGIGAGFSTVINAWSPYQLYGPSDFDLRHQINFNWVWQLPFGRGQAFGRNIGRGLDAVVGGWQISGVGRWTSGFPANTNAGYNWSTDWELGGNGSLTGQPIPQGRSSLASQDCGANGTTNGGWNMFSNVCQAYNGFSFPLPGTSGVRNAIRGDGFASLDMGLSKIWHMPYNEAHTVQFRWDVFNVPNLKRFDVASVNNELDQGVGVFGQYTRLLTNPRIMQFNLRYQF